MTTFDNITDRHNTNSYKWDSCPDPQVLPMWVADMDFPTAPCVLDALRRRVEHGIFGYVRVPDAYYNSLVSWFSRRHGWTMQPDWVIYTSGVVPAISAIIKAMTNPGDKVLALTPVYNCFFSSIRNNGCILESCQLHTNQLSYSIDFEDFERRASQPDVKLFLLCNPHNPGGRVWTKEELTRLAEICLKHNVFVVSDEIHCEFVFPGHKYTPFASLDARFLHNCAICTSPSKAFNIAGLQIANITIAHEDIRRRVDKAININEVCDVNPFGVEALMAAYTPEGEQWLNNLVAYIHSNYLYAREWMSQHLPQLPLITLEGTYLLWIDCRSLNKSSETIEQELLHKAKLWLNSGSMYGTPGEGYMRLNLATQRTRVQEGLKRLEDYINFEVGK